MIGKATVSQRGCVCVTETSRSAIPVDNSRSDSDSEKERDNADSEEEEERLHKNGTPKRTLASAVLNESSIASINANLESILENIGGVSVTEQQLQEISEQIIEHNGLIQSIDEDISEKQAERAEVVDKKTEVHMHTPSSAVHIHMCVHSWRRQRKLSQPNLKLMA